MSERREHAGRLVSVFGTPSGFSRFGCFVLHNLLRVTVKEFNHLATSDIQHLREALSSRRHPNFFLFSDCPDRAIVETYLKTRASLLILLQDPEEVALELITERNIDPAWAVRFTEQSITTFSELLSCDHSIVISREKRQSLAEFVVKAAEHFYLNTVDNDLESIAKAVAPNVKHALDISMDDLYRQHLISRRLLDSKDIDRSITKRYEPIFQRVRRLAGGAIINEIEWPVCMFMAANAPNAEFNGKVELVGPARCVVYGPYMHLPFGLWGLRAHLHIDDNLSGNEIEIDVYQSEVLVRNCFTLPPNGELEVRAQFENKEPRVPIQLRFIIMEGAIEGAITIKSVSLIRLDRFSE